MKILPTEVDSVFVIESDVHDDERGFFMETYREDVLAQAGIVDDFVQDNHSRSVHRNTVRGLHFQWERPMAKLMRVTRGNAFLVAVDLRKDSPTLGKWVGIEASDDNKRQLYAPASFARGFQTLTDMCEVQYKCSAFYNPDAQGTIRWNDPDVAIQWPVEGMPHISGSSAAAPSFKEWLQRPESEIFKTSNGLS